VSTLTLRNALTVFEDGGRPADIWIDGEVIAGIYEPGTAPMGDRVVECSGLAALPGLIDLHGHMVYNILPLWSPPGRTDPAASG